MKVPEPRKLSSGKWFIQLRLGGESVSISDFSKKECLRRAQFAKAEYLAGKREKRRQKAPTLTQAIDQYIAQRDNTLSPATIRGYRTIQRNRFQEQMPRRLDQIDPAEWQGIVNQEASRCGPKTLKNAWGFVRGVVESAAGIPPPEITLPLAPPPDKPFLTPEQIRLFVPAIFQTKYAVPALLALSSLRASEIQALQWENIPPNPQFIRVSGAVVPDEHHRQVRKRQNKNAASARNVPVMIPELAAALERDRQPSGPVLCCGQNSLRRAIEKVCRANGMPNVGIHGLRHSFASLAYHLRVPEKIAMEIGGWADASTMHKIYTHIAKSDISRYQSAMTQFFESAAQPLAPPTEIR